ncbi:MAG: PAS domain S-box protein, partial [bacterium]
MRKKGGGTQRIADTVREKAAQRAGENLFELALDAGGISILKVDADLHLHWVHRGTEGVNLKLLEKAQTVPSEDRPESPDFHDLLLANLKERTQIEITLSLKIKGTTRYFDVTSIPQGKINSSNDDFHLILRESSDRHEQLAIFRSLAENNEQGVIVFQDDRIVFANARACEISGYKEDELLQMDRAALLEAVHPEDRKTMALRLESRLAGKKVTPPTYACRIRHTSGDYRSLEAYTSRILHHGRPAILNTFIDKTYEHAVLQQLRESEETFRLSIENMINSFASFQPVHDENGEIVDLEYVYVNQAAEQSNQMSRDQMIGKRLSEVFPTVVMSGHLVELIDVLKSGVPFVADNYWLEVDLDGKHIGRSFNVRASRLRDNLIVSWRDVTENWRSKLELQSAEEQYRRMVAEAADGIVVIDHQGIARYLNRAAEIILGRSAEEIIGSQFGFPVGAGKLTDVTIVQPDGELLYVEMNAAESTWEGAPVYLAGLRNITDAKKAEKVLHAEKERYLSLFNSIRDALVVVDVHRKIVDCNPAFSNLFGYKPEEIIGKQTHSIYENRDLYEKMGRVIRKHRDDPDFLFTVNYKRANGDVFPGETKVFYRYDTSGGFVGFIGLIRDISRLLAEEERILFQSQLLEAVNQSVVATDAQGKIIYWNEAAEQLYGWSAAEALGRKIVETTPSFELEGDAGEIMRRLATGKSWSGEYSLQRRDGSRFRGMVHDSPILDGDGNLQGVIGITTDITRQLKFAEDLRKLHMAMSQSPV